jgi:hypothetical protein
VVKTYVRASIPIHPATTRPTDTRAVVRGGLDGLGRGGEHVFDETTSRDTGEAYIHPDFNTVACRPVLHRYDFSLAQKVQNQPGFEALNGAGG